MDLACLFFFFLQEEMVGLLVLGLCRTASSHKQVYILFSFRSCAFVAVDEEMKLSLLCFGTLASEKATELTEEHLFSSVLRVMSTAACVFYLSAFPA